MASNQQNYEEQMHILQQRFPQQPVIRLRRLLQRKNGDADEVAAQLFRQEFRAKKWEQLEARFGATVTALQQEFPPAQSMKRIRLLKHLEHFGGDVEQVRKLLKSYEEQSTPKGTTCFGVPRRQRYEELKVTYAAQLAELAELGVNVHCPGVIRQLEKSQGDTKKILERQARRTEKKQQLTELDDKYAGQVAQLEADGVFLKNRRILFRLLQKADGNVDTVKQLLNERKEKHKQRKEYRRRHRSSSTGKHHDEVHTSESSCNKRRDLSADDRDNLKRLRSAGVHGHPMRILGIFHECNESIELTLARIQQEREQRERNRDERKAKRTLLNEVQHAYIMIDDRNDWPADIEQVYLDGNNMMFVIDSLRRLCLNRKGKKTERAIGEIAAAWNQHMQIANVDLIFDSTSQLDQIGTVKVRSAQPKYPTTDDMLIDLAQQVENREKNKRTIIITSDRALAVQLQREGCLLVKPYHWFAHCVMILTPDLINREEQSNRTTSQKTTKTNYNFDQLVHRVANIEL